MTKNNDIGNLTRYIMPELMPQVWCTACLGVVLKHNPKAKELIDEIVNCFDLPGFKEINKVSDKIVPDKKDAYTFLDVKVSATPEGACIKSFIDSKLLTTGQTSG